MSNAPGRERGGLLATVKNIATTLLTIGKTRLELLGNEIEEEKLRAVRLLLLAQTMMFCLGVGVLLGVALLTTLFWDNRIALLAVSCATFLALGGLAFIYFKRATQRPEAVFAASIAELKEDLQQLKEAAARESANQ